MWWWLAGVAGAAEGSDVLGESTHVEVEVGFLAGDRSLGAVPFEQRGAGRPLAGLDASFRSEPLSDALVTGPRAELRAVAPPLRVSLGWQRPYPDWQVVPERADRDGAGAPVVSEVRALRTDEVLLGIGLEAPTGVLVPFVDLVGTVHASTVALSVDGRTARYASEAFSLGGRAGLRLQVSDHLFAQAAGTATAVGPSTWGASLGLGAAF